MRKVGLVVPGGVDRSGTRRVVPALLWLIKRLATQYDLHVFALRQEPAPAQYSLLGAMIHVSGGGPVRSRLRGLAQIVREHGRGSFALFHAIWASPSGVVAALAGRILRRPVLVHLAGGELAAMRDIGYGGRRSVHGRLQVRLALGAAEKITAPSEPMRSAARRLGYDSVRLPLGVGLEDWPVRAPRPRDSSRPAQLLHVGSINLVKDQLMLLRAAALLAKESVPFELSIVGVDTLNGELQRRAAALGLSERVRFHGFLPQQRLRPLVERADLLLVSSRHEAGPVAVLEAAMTGVPTVGTAVGHVAEWAPRAAVAVTIGDERALASATAALLADEDRRQRIAAAAQALAIAEDADWTALAVSTVYRELIETREGT